VEGTRSIECFPPNGKAKRFREESKSKNKECKESKNVEI